MKYVKSQMFKFIVVTHYNNPNITTNTNLKDFRVFVKKVKILPYFFSAEECFDWLFNGTKMHSQPQSYQIFFFLILFFNWKMK